MAEREEILSRSAAHSGDPISELILQLARLPGIGERTAARLAFHIIRRSSGRDPGEQLASDLAASLLEVTQRVRFCEECQNLCVGPRCPVCEDKSRECNVLCVVEGVQDLRAVEATGDYHGLYHVLHGALAPLDGIGPEDLRIPELLDRLEKHQIEEVILATNADVEGDATALYLARLIRPLGLEVSRLASGVPLGGELEYLDSATLGRALAERRRFFAE